MSTNQELFRFFTLRRTERLLSHRIEGRLIRDPRPNGPGSVLDQTLGPEPFEQRLGNAERFRASARHLAPDDPLILGSDRAADVLRTHLLPGEDVADLAATIQAELPGLGPLLQSRPPQTLIKDIIDLNGRLWDSLYAEIVRGSAIYTRTNHLADGIRVLHLFRLLWVVTLRGDEAWTGGAFDEYELIVDQRAARVTPDPDEPGHLPRPQPAPGSLERAGPPAAPRIGGPQGDATAPRTAAARLADVDDAFARVTDALERGDVDASSGSTRLSGPAAERLKEHPALARYDMAEASVDDLLEGLNTDRRRYARRMVAENRRAAPARPAGRRAPARGSASTALAAPGAAASGTLTAQSVGGPLRGRFDVPLEVGEIRPPVVGDLLLVEQELRRYELGEIADIENVMAREQKERSSRTTSRMTQTSSTETEEERETTESRTVDERFSLASEAQKAASQSISLSAGVSASGKFGPMQVSATANASFSSSKSSSESTSQEFARQVTEEATERVRSAIKQSSSLTLFTENQKTALHGFDNRASDAHVVGIYRWVDKIYEARTMNYGRRLMLDLSVPEPAAFFRGLMTKSELDGAVELEEPVHPSQLHKTSFTPLGAPGPNGFQSFLDVTEDNYARLAAVYDVTDVSAPPLEKITGAKTVVYPEADTADKVTDHSDEVNELSYVWSDTSLALDPDYRLERVGVWAPKGASGGFGWYSDVLKLGTKANKFNVLTVLVANKSFYFYAEGPEDNRTITTNFNTTEDIADGELFTGNVTPAIPIQFAADFEGIVNFTVIYTAFLRDEARDAWKQRIYAAVLQGYERKKREYDEAKAVAESKVQAELEERTYQLRDSQYRAIELEEIKRGSIDILTKGTAAGYWSLSVSADGDVTIYHDEDDIQPYWTDWRSPLANGTVATFFEEAFEWENVTSTFYPYYWTAESRWRELLEGGSADPIFEAFLRAGQARVVLPVRPGFGRAVHYFLKTGLVWGGGYLPLFQSADMLESYADVETQVQLDPPVQVGDSWEVRLPTSFVILQEDSVLPEFPAEDEEEDEVVPASAGVDPGAAPF